MTTTLRERVEAGAAWLDQVEPGWRDQISLAKLRMLDCERCICGQVFALAAAQKSRPVDGYRFALELAGHKDPFSEEGPDWAYFHGFHALGPGEDDIEHEPEQRKWQRLAREWRNFIREGARREPHREYA